MTMITNNDNDKTRQATLADVAQFRLCLHWGVSRSRQGEGERLIYPFKWAFKRASYIKHAVAAAAAASAVDL